MRHPSNKRPRGHDSSAELGLKTPVRDQDRLGAHKYSVTPPRSKVRAPVASETGKASCRTCSAELDPTESYRVDADEYVYHFCGAECYQRWREQATAGGTPLP